MCCAYIWSKDGPVETVAWRDIGHIELQRPNRIRLQIGGRGEHPVRGRPTLLVHPVGVVDLGRAVHREPDEELVRRHEEELLPPHGRTAKKPAGPTPPPSR